MSLPIIFLLLTKNEEKTISNIVVIIKNNLKKLELTNYQIFLSDDSTDKTREKAIELGCKIIDGGGKGLGNAYYAAIKVLKKLNFECLISLDCDGQTDLNDIKKFRDLIVIDKFDLVTASRFLKNNSGEVNYNYPLINRVGIFFLSNYISIMSGQKFTDSHGGIRAMSKKAVQNMKIFGRWTYVQESILDCKENGCKMIEVSSAWYPREHGTSLVVGSIPRYILKVAPILIFRILYRFFR